MSRSSITSDRLCLRAGAAFTLVELLVVMGVISVLLVAVLPAFKGLGLSTSSRGAISTMMGVLDRARMMAISDGMATYVVFACPSSGGTQMRSDLTGAAYAIFEDHDNVSFAPEQRTPWMRLPTNIALKINDDGGLHTSITTRTPKATDATFPVSSTALASGSTPTSLQLPYWKFDSTGALDVQDPLYLRLLMFPGVVNSTGNEVVTQSTSGTNAAVKYYEIDINPATGRAKYVLNPQDNLATPTPTPST